MADSIREKIMANVETTLEGITTAAGYNSTIQRVYRIRLAGLNIQEFPSIVVIPGREINAEEPVDRYTERLSFVLECWLKEASKDDIATQVNKLVADVQKALLVDYTRGGMAINTKLLGNEPFYNDVNAPYGGVDIEIEIHYRHQYSDPYIQG